MYLVILCLCLMIVQGSMSFLQSPVLVHRVVRNQHKHCPRLKIIERKLRIRGGQLSSHLPNVVDTILSSSPTSALKRVLVGLLSSSALLKLSMDKTNLKLIIPSQEGRSLRWRYLVVFWLLRMADWLQGPYFYEAYSTKITEKGLMTLETISKLFLTGFAATGRIFRFQSFAVALIH